MYNVILLSLFCLVYSIYDVLSQKVSVTPVKGLLCISFIKSVVYRTVFSLSCDFIMYFVYCIALCIYCVLPFGVINE